MNETIFEKIEQFLNGELSNEERAAFELELKANDELNSAVRLYKTIDTEMRNSGKYSRDEEAFRKTLAALNANYFKAKPQVIEEEKITVVKKINLFRWLPYAIAASLLLFVLIIFPYKNTPQQLAKNYVSRNLTTLSPIMGSGEDLLQAGIAAYNKKQYDSALLFFTGYLKINSGSTDAKKNIGLVYLVTNDYDAAIKQFQELSNIKGLQNNPGMFLKAITLLERNKNGDQEEAKLLLQQVAAQKSADSADATELLKKL